MKFLGLFFVAALSVSAVLPKAQAPDAAHLAAVLAQMDKASADFKGARADVSQEYYERAAKDTTTDTGSVYFQRKGNSTQMGLVTLKADGNHVCCSRYRSSNCSSSAERKSGTTDRPGGSASADEGATAGLGARAAALPSRHRSM